MTITPDQLTALNHAFAAVTAVRCKPGSKDIMPGAPTIEPTALVNRAGVNGSGGLVIIDFDGKNGASKAELFAAFPGMLEVPTLVISTASSGCWHYVYRWPSEKFIRKDAGSVMLVPGVEVPHFYMMYGSVVQRRRYEVIEDNPVADLPADLYAVLVGDWVEEAVAPLAAAWTSGGEEARARRLLERFSEYEPGRTNEKFLQTALPVLGILGVDRGTAALEAAWPNPDTPEAEISRRVASAVAKFDPEARPEAVLTKYSRTRRAIALAVLEEARYGVWRGHHAPNDRRILLAVAWRCFEDNELTAHYPAETIANRVGIKPADVRASIRRLQEAGWLVWIKEHGLVSLTCSELVRLTIKGDKNIGDIGEVTLGSLLHPVDRVWRSGSLRARHAQMFDLVDAGVRTRRELQERSGAGRTTVHETVGRLVSAGLLEEKDGLLRVAAGAVSAARELRADAEETYSKVRAGIDRDHDRLDDYRQRQRAEAELLIEESLRDYRREMEEEHWR